MVPGERFVRLTLPRDSARRMVDALEGAGALLVDEGERLAEDPGSPGGAFESLDALRRVLGDLHGALVLAADPPPSCGHSACRQHWIDSGRAECVAHNAGDARTGGLDDES